MKTARVDPAVLPRLGLLIPPLLLISTTAADPDLWGHVAFGRDILAARSIPAVDTYSFTSDIPWVNHEWLWELVLAGAYAAGGASGLIVLRLGVLAVTFLLVGRALHRSGLPPMGRDLLLVLAIAGSYAITQTVRPQLFSVLAFAWLLAQLAETNRIGWRALGPVPIVMCLWANMHGGMLVGLGSLGVWIGATLLIDAMDTASGAAIDRRGPLVLGLIGVVALMATVINPYGVELWRFLGATVSFTRGDITEWQPLTSVPVARIGLWAAAAGVATFAAIAGRTRLPALAVIILMAYASLRVRRLDGFFILAAVILSAPALAAAIDRVKGRHRSARVPAVTAARATGTRIAVALVAVLALVAVDGRLRPTGRFGCIDTSDVRLVDPATARFLGSANLRGRMLTWFDWGEYAIWHLAPDVRVSMDGRRETVYSPDVVQAHLAFYNGHDNLALLDRLDPEYAWLPTGLSAVRAMEDRGWRRLSAGTRSVVLAAPSAPGPIAASPWSGPAPRCFPNP